MSFLKKYLLSVSEEDQKSGAISFLAGLDHVGETAPEIRDAIVQELKDQRSHLKLIASENYCSLAVQQAMGNLLTDKYAEGHVFHRFYAGCDNVDRVEAAAVDAAKELFGCDHAYVQPHSGADANLVAFWAILVHRIQTKEMERLGKKKIGDLTKEEYEAIRQLLVNQKMMGMSLNSGGHLTHGYRLNISSKFMQSVSYDVDPQTHLIDYDKLAKQVKEERPLILVAGYSAYPRLINFAKMREIADSVGATLFVDMAHFAGLVAGKVLTGEFNPIPYADVITSTTHKTLRGPRGGLILCKQEYAETIDKGCPVVLGGPLPHVMAAKAVAFKEALTRDYQAYAGQVVANARALAETLKGCGAHVITEGTDNHLILIDVKKSYGISGKQAESALREAFFTVNRNTVPFDVNGPWFTSGVRMGTPAVTTLGMKEAEMQEIGAALHQLLKATKPAPGKTASELSLARHLVDPVVLGEVQGRIRALLEQFPLYPELILEPARSPAML